MAWLLPLDVTVSLSRLYLHLPSSVPPPCRRFGPALATQLRLRGRMDGTALDVINTIALAVALRLGVRLFSYRKKRLPLWWRTVCRTFFASPLLYRHAYTPPCTSDTSPVSRTTRSPCPVTCDHVGLVTADDLPPLPLPQHHIYRCDRSPTYRYLHAPHYHPRFVYRFHLHLRAYARHYSIPDVTNQEGRREGRDSLPRSGVPTFTFLLTNTLFCHTFILPCINDMVLGHLGSGRTYNAGYYLIS